VNAVQVETERMNRSYSQRDLTTSLKMGHTGIHPPLTAAQRRCQLLCRRKSWLKREKGCLEDNSIVCPAQAQKTGIDWPSLEGVGDRTHGKLYKGPRIRGRIRDIFGSSLLGKLCNFSCKFLRSSPSYLG
jgi:hypothetical protein